MSIQAIVPQMAAAQAFGEANYGSLDALTFSLGHPDASAALMGFHGEIDGHFGSAPFQYKELRDPGIHRVVDSFEVLGVPHTFNVVWTTTRYHDANPRIMSAFLAVLDRGETLIASDPGRAARLYVREENSNIPVDDLAAMIRRPENKRLSRNKRSTGGTGSWSAKANHPRLWCRRTEARRGSPAYAGDDEGSRGP